MGRFSGTRLPRGRATEFSCEDWVRVGFGWWAAVKAVGGIFGAGRVRVLVWLPVEPRWRFGGLDAAGCVPRTPSSATEFSLSGCPGSAWLIIKIQKIQKISAPGLTGSSLCYWKTGRIFQLFVARHLPAHSLEFAYVSPKQVLVPRRHGGLKVATAPLPPRI